MRLEDIYIGDTLRIRDWDDMLAEYGSDIFGILVRHSFSECMRYLCGKIITVKSIDRTKDRISSKEGYELGSCIENPSMIEWAISAEMLEPCLQVLPEPEEDYTTIDLSEFLS